MITALIIMHLFGGGGLELFSRSDIRTVEQTIEDRSRSQVIRRAMQRINEDILNPVFFVFFFGTLTLCLLIIALAALESAADGHRLMIAGAICYLAGPFGITVLFNVPLNNQLARTEPDEANDAWPSYMKRWQRCNHIRTYIGVLAIALLSFGIANT